MSEAREKRVRTGRKEKGKGDRSEERETGMRKERQE